jgi:fatty acid desaturase
MAEHVCKTTHQPLDKAGLGDLQRLVNEALAPFRSKDARSTSTALQFLCRDLALIAVWCMVVFLFPYNSGGAWWRAACGAVHAVVGGTLAMALWILAHECGHGAFSNSPTVNHGVGLLLHTALLVPFAPWRDTHRIHHRFVNDLVRGTSHVPPLETELAHRLVERIYWLAACSGPRLFGVLNLVGRTSVGWPAYLLVNATGSHVEADCEDKPLALVPSWKSLFLDHSHFVPWSKVLPRRNWRAHLLSQVCWAGCACVLLWAARVHGIEAVLFWYGGPVLVVGIWIIGYTWLQHTHPDVPHYGPETHQFLVAAMCTVDRPYTRCSTGCTTTLG